MRRSKAATAARQRPSPTPAALPDDHQPGSAQTIDSRRSAALLTSAEITGLQRTIGNRATADLLAAQTAQQPTPNALARLIQRTKLYRVQGGASRQLIVIDGGSITEVDESSYIYIAIEDALADKWRQKSNRTGAQLLVMEVSPQFVRALENESEAHDFGLPPAQKSQDPSWKGVSYAIKGSKWAEFLKAQQDKGKSKVWDMDKYFAQFEDDEKEPADEAQVEVFDPDEPGTVIETTTYALYKQGYLSLGWKYRAV